MSRRLWRCRNRDCPVPHGAVLGRLTVEGILIVDESIQAARCYLERGQALIKCPACGHLKTYFGLAVHFRSRIEQPTQSHFCSECIR